MNQTQPNHIANNVTVGANGKTPSAADSQFFQALMAQANGDGAPTGPPALSTTPTLTGLLQALRRRWATAVGLAALAAAATVLAVFQLMPPKFPVSIRVRVTAAKANVQDDVEFPIFKANMEWLAKSPLVLNAALNQKLPDGREVKDLDMVRSKGLAALDWLEKTLKTEYILNAPEILKITLPSENAEEGAALLNAVAIAFLKEYADMEGKKRGDRIRELTENKAKLDAGLQTLLTQLADDWKRLELRDQQAMSVTQQQLVQALNAEIAANRANQEAISLAEGDLISLKAKLKGIDSLRMPDDVLDQFTATDPTIQGYEKIIFENNKLILNIRQSYVDPTVSSRESKRFLEQNARAREMRAQREAELLPALETKYRAAMRAQYERDAVVAQDKLEQHRSRQATLLKNIAEFESKVRDSGPQGLKPAKIAGTEQKIDTAKLTINQAAAKIQEVEMEVPGSRVQQIDRASAPMARDASRQTKIGGAGGAGVFGLVLFGIAFLEFRSRKICMTDDVTHGLGLNVIGTVPAMPARPGKNAKQDEHWQNQLHESVDAIRTVLLHNARNEAHRVIMVTSANSGEGKTTLASQLGASLARAWKRTLIIDGDLRHPATHKLFDVPQEPGLSEILRGEVEVPDAVRATAFSRLWVLPAGNGDTHAIQALAQDSVAAIFESLKQQYDFIIVDSPPVLPVTDSLLLGQHVDGVLFSILRDVSRAPAVYAAQQKLAPLRVHTLGAVVLGTQTEFGNKNYRYTMATAK